MYVKQELERSGVVRIPTVFSLDEVSLIRRAALDVMARGVDNCGYNSGYQIQWRNSSEGRWPSILFWPALADRYLENIRRKPHFVSIVKMLCGDNVKQLNNQIYFRIPGDGDTFSPHRDIRFRRGVKDRELLLNSYIQTVIAVDKVTVENSPIEFFIGSHTSRIPDGVSDDSELRALDEQQAQNLRLRYESRKFTMNPGDILAWKLMTLHCSSKNASDRMRMTYMNGFAHARSVEDWPMFLQNGELADLNGDLVPVT